MSTGNYDLQINWPSGRHSSAGTITDEQWGEIARILSPGWQAGAVPVAHRLVNCLGEVVTEWHDGPPPERVTDACGVVQTDVTVELAYAAPQPAARQGQGDEVRINALESWAESGCIDLGVEIDGGVYLTVSLIGDPPIELREQHSVRSAIDAALTQQATP